MAGWVVQAGVSVWRIADDGPFDAVKREPNSRRRACLNAADSLDLKLS